MRALHRLVLLFAALAPLGADASPSCAAIEDAIVRLDFGSPGLTERQVIEQCGAPLARELNGLRRWMYFDGSHYVVVVTNPDDNVYVPVEEIVVSALPLAEATEASSSIEKLPQSFIGRKVASVRRGDWRVVREFREASLFKKTIDAIEFRVGPADAPVLLRLYHDNGLVRAFSVALAL